MTETVTKETTTTQATGADATVAKNSPANGQKAATSQTVGYIVYFIFGVIEILLLFRLVLRLTGANPGSSFVDFIYGLTQVFILPFTGIFHQATTQGVETTAVLEPATIVAIVVYGVLAWGITQLVVILSGRLQH